jgi:hypothetical protein
MARKVKKSLDYFTLDVVFSDSIRLASKEIKGGHGLSLIIELWQKIYGSHGYYMNFDKDSRILFLDYSITKIDLEELDRCLQILFNRNIFNQDIYDKYEVLTSDSIQDRYIYICTSSKRVNIELIDEYLCIDQTQYDLSKYILRSLIVNNYKEVHSQCNKYGINDSDSVIDTGKSTQIKEKEIKEKNIKKVNFKNPLTFSQIIEELKKESNQKNIILAQYKTTSKTLDTYIDFFNCNYMPEDESEVFELSEKRTHFKNFLKNNWNKIPQQQEQKPKVKYL